MQLIIQYKRKMDSYHFLMEVLQAAVFLPDDLSCKIETDHYCRKETWFYETGKS